MGKDALLTVMNDAPTGWASSLLQSIPASYTVWYDSTDSVYRAEANLTGGTDYNGATAHTTINNALGALTAGRTWQEKVSLRGTFTLSSTILVPSYTILDLANAKLLMPTGTNDNIIENDTPAGVQTNISIIGGVLDGQDTALTSGKKGIVLQNVQDCLVSGSYLRNVFWGVTLNEVAGVGTNAYNTIENCTVDRYNSGIVINGNYNLISGCKAYNMYQGGFSFYGRKASIGFNEWRSNFGFGTVAAEVTGVGIGFGEYASPNHMVIGGAFTGLYPEDAVHNTGTSGGSNTFSHIQAYDIQSGEGFYSSNDYDKFVNCTARACDENGFYLAGHYQQMIGCNSAHNEKCGILLGVGSDRSEVANCKIYNNDQGGASSCNISLYHPDYVEIHDCQIFDDQGAGATANYGILESGDTNYGKYYQNLYYGHTSSHITITGTSSIGDLQIRALASLDLSGAATDLIVWHAPRNYYLLGYKILYTEASSADVDWPADAVRIGRYQDGVALDDDYFDETVTEASKSLGYVKTFVSGNLTNRVITAGDTVTVGTGGGKTGTGEVLVILNVALL